MKSGPDSEINIEVFLKSDSYKRNKKIPNSATRSVACEPEAEPVLALLPADKIDLQSSESITMRKEILSRPSIKWFYRQNSFQITIISSKLFHPALQITALINSYTISDHQGFI